MKNIHIMGICGTGMAALAGMLQEAGFAVSGSDANVYPPMSDFLASRNIHVCNGYKPENLLPRPDFVVVGNVITRKNPEAIALADSGIPYGSFPQTLSHFFIQEKKSFVVTGTHGKTTTSSLLASMLHSAGQTPSFMIGGLVQAFGRNFNVVDGDYFVAEGDEYDTAFFDKGPKFLHYRPHVAIITSLEFDHADIYENLDAIKRSFRKLVALMPKDGLLVAHLDDLNVREVVEPCPCPVVGYGEGENNDWRLSDLTVSTDKNKFNVNRAGDKFGSFSTSMIGHHNALNSLAVIVVLDSLGIATDTMQKGFDSFEGIKRRQEVRGRVNGITVIDDFAHHPTAVRETLCALRAAYAGKRLVAVFEPRTNSSRRSIFQQQYVSVFNDADRVIIKEPEPLMNIPESERFSSEKLVDDLCEKGINATYFKATESIIDHLAENSRPDDIIAILSNGGFDNIHVRLLERLAA